MREKTLKLEINDKEYAVTINEFSAYEAVVTVNGKTYTVGLKDLGIEQVSDLKPKNEPNDPSTIPAPAQQVSTPAKSAPKSATAVPDSAIVAPLPGLILKINIKPGDSIKAGQVVLIMEAMKMENDIQALADGTVKSIAVKEGDSVNEGDVLVELV
ncbi:MAG: biotin/lipoyl-binding protein [Candidatus Marinimicrobia bacterium]|nr:biotin/lipoyl-binding protein [Candidatus Neomarinimicrobiota bacterium]